jgi:ABC-2 type transport system permease protein
VSLRNTVRTLPVMLKIGFSEAVAYRAEFLIWVLTTTMPLIMLALWSAVAAEAPVGRFGQTQFTAYFLATFIVRQLTSSWAAWQMNFEIRHGTMSMRLLKPVHPLWAYAAEHWAAMPLRLVVALPMAAVALAITGSAVLPSGAALWAAWLASMAGAWLITFLLNITVGCLAFHLESSVKVMDVWFALFFVASGYLMPVELFPPTIRTIVDWLPFRYQLGLPVELLTGAHDLHGALWMLLRQWGFVLLMTAIATLAWRTGVRRFEAYGG